MGIVDWLKDIVDEKKTTTTSIEVNGVTISVGDTIQPTLHREGYEHIREEPEWVVLGFEEIDGCAAVKIRRLGEKFPYTALIGVKGEDWYRTFRVIKPVADDPEKVG